MLLKRSRKHCWNWNEKFFRQFTHQTLPLLIIIYSDRCMAYLVSASQMPQIYENRSMDIVDQWISSKDDSSFRCGSRYVAWNNHENRWKILLYSYYINFFIVIKKIAKIGKNFCTNLIIYNKICKTIYICRLLFEFSSVC